MDDNLCSDLPGTTDSLPLEPDQDTPALPGWQRASLQQLIKAIREQDDLAILVACDPRLPASLLTKDQRTAISQAHWRLRNRAILKKAVERGDERTIRRWYRQAWFGAGTAFLPGEAGFIQRAVAPREPAIPAPAAQPHPGDPPAIAAWLQGDLPAAPPQAAEQAGALERAIGDLGFETRLEDALQANDRAAVLRLIRPESMDQHAVSGDLRERIRSCLAAPQ